MTFLLPSWLRAPAVFAALFLAAACADNESTVLPEPPLDRANSVRLECRASVTSLSVTCSAPATADGVHAEQSIVGGQGVYVRLTSSGVAYDAGTQIFSFNTTVQNLLTLAMATADGATRHANGVQVFFDTDPIATTGAGAITVANKTGTGAFTRGSQDYFQYGGQIGGVDQPELGADGILASSEVSAAKQWQLNVPNTVTTFSFLLYVSTETTAGALVSAAPQITSISPSPLVPGATATLTGTNFDATAANNVVTIGGVAASITGATTTSLTVTVPCTASGSVPIAVTRGGMRGATFNHPLLVPQRTLAVGASVIVSNQAEVGCNEITASGVNSRYVVAVYNTSTTPTSTVAVQVSGDPAGPPAPSLAAPSPRQSLQTGLRAPGAISAADERHYDLLEKNRAEYVALRARFANDPRMRRSAPNRAPVEPPATRTFHVSNINVGSICTNYYVATGTRVYYSGKIAIYEDDATPAGLKAAANATMQDYYNRIGDQFNADMEPILRNNFGDPLRRDAVTDNNGVLVAFFTPLINNNFAGVAGFVVSCDQFPDADAAEPAVGGPYAGTTNQNGASNFGEVFYAYQPTSTASGFNTQGTPDYWYRTIRSTFIHESKHVVSNAAHVANGAPSLEVAWLEEGTARHSEEMWMREAVDNVAWKANTGYGSLANPINLYCDARPEGSPACAANTRRPATIMQRHFFSLYTQMAGTNGALLSPFGRTPYDNQSYFYAISWSLARYSIDRYGASDAAFLTGLTQSLTTGTTNLAAQAGVSLEQLMGGWALSLAADDYPGLATPGADIQMPTWNFRDIYAGINTDGFSPLAYPLAPTALSYGAFASVNVAELYGGGVRWFEFSGVQTEPQLVRLLGSGGGTLPSTVRVAIARVQ